MVMPSSTVIAGQGRRNALGNAARELLSAGVADCDNRLADFQSLERPNSA